MSDIESGQSSPNLKESSIPQPPIGSEAVVIAQALFPLARSMMEHVANACHPMAEATHIVDDIKSQLYSTNMLLKQAKLVVETAATATKQSQTWGLAAVVSAKISVTIMLFVFIFLGFLLA
ncbi:hypothetical protein NRY68_08105 [Acidithiobacillus ferrooxidans]|jgi:hypothetical protein|uniref:hypothetical protein n=1 Tax=Acidithiobacillus ferrooxidans TaxID=920 RepID=UPI00214807AF|nr:hypothetical protein [Acidithiobacillus ferrooxidans]MCR1345763.1 hypothetical protein [Acidithiobacillus ferrooxidans]MCR1355683.1 hypothetical protein [Acidithiobacillus ferrooxidans]